MVDVSEFHQDNPKPYDNRFEIDSNPRASAMDEMRSYGFVVPPVAVIGGVQRVATADDTHKKQSGWYIYQEFPDFYNQGAYVGVLVFGSWRGHPEKVTWSSKRRETMTTEEAGHMARLQTEAKIKRDEQKRQDQEAARIKAQAIWDAAVPVTDHQYLTNKGVKPNGLRQSTDPKYGSLIATCRDENDALMSLQFIGTDGKRFLAGGRVEATAYQFGDTVVDDQVYVAEGWATAATIHEATGSICYAAFNTGNLMNVAGWVKDKYKDATMIICGDDDRWTDGNPGRSYGTAAANVTMSKIVFPEFENLDDKPTDFNDLSKQISLSKIKAMLLDRKEAYEASTTYDALDPDLLHPPGMLGDIAAYYNATARSPQPGFAVQSALAVASIVLARNFRTTTGNHTSLYFLNVAKSSTGKEHGKTIIEEILEAAGLDSLLNGGGYTSAGAVFSTLLRKPRHITIIDELGRYLEATNGKSQTNYLEANTELMEAIGRLGGQMRPKAYSTMTLSKEKAEEFAARKIYNPAITLYTMTTPSTFFNSISSNAIADGFINRFIIHQSDMPRRVRDHKEQIDVPYKITKWIKEVLDRAGYNAGNTDDPTNRPTFITLAMTGEALAIHRVFEQTCIDLADDLEQFGMAELPGRSAEMAMRISLIVALSKNPDATAVSADDMEWSIKYIEQNLRQMVGTMKMNVSGSEFEANKKAMLSKLRLMGDDGITWNEAMKTPPFSHHKPRDLKELLQSLVDSETITFGRVKNGKPGRPREAYFALK